MITMQDLKDMNAADMLANINTKCGSTPVLQFWAGTMPLTCEDPDTGTMLCENACSNPCWGSIVGMTITMNTVTDGTAVADGDVVYVRLKKTSGSTGCVAQWEVGADFTFSGGTVTTGDTVHVNSITADLITADA